AAGDLVDVRCGPGNRPGELAPYGSDWGRDPRMDLRRAARLRRSDPRDARLHRRLLLDARLVGCLAEPIVRLISLPRPRGRGEWARAGDRLAREVGQPLEHVVNRDGRAHDDDGDWADLRERYAGQVGDRADGETGPCSKRRLPVEVGHE